MYERILLPLDGSSLAEEAVPHAVAIAERFGAEVILVAVLMRLPVEVGSHQPSLRQAEERSRARMREYLEEVATRFREEGVPVEVVTKEGTPHAEIVRLAEARSADLIVMCSRGRSGLSRWLIGSVADRVMRGAGVPVVLVRAHGEG